MSKMGSRKISDVEFIEVIKNSGTMSEACNKLNMHFSTFRGRANRLGVYEPNQGSKGLTKPKKSSAKNNFLLEDVLNGKHPNCQTRRLKIKLIREGIFEDKCCKCGWDKKRPGDKYSACELHHKDGNNKNHKLENLEILCPNCHALTENFRNCKRN